MKLSEH